MYSHFENGIKKKLSHFLVVGSKLVLDLIEKVTSLFSDILPFSRYIFNIIFSVMCSLNCSLR